MATRKKIALGLVMACLFGPCLLVTLPLFPVGCAFYKSDKQLAFDSLATIEAAVDKACIRYADGVAAGKVTPADQVIVNADKERYSAAFHRALVAVQGDKLKVAPAEVQDLEATLLNAIGRALHE